MPNSPSIVQHALDLLEPLGPVQARSMFGGHGLYTRGVMFGLIIGDELFLKTDELNRDTFRAAGCEAWIYTGRRTPMETSYFRPPENALEDPDAMLPWATLGLEAALRKQSEKKAPRRKSSIKTKGSTTKAKPGTKPKASKAVVVTKPTRPRSR